MTYRTEVKPFLQLQNNLTSPEEHLWQSCSDHRSEAMRDQHKNKQKKKTVCKMSPETPECWLESDPCVKQHLYCWVFICFKDLICICESCCCLSSAGPSLSPKCLNITTAAAPVWQRGSEPFNLLFQDQFPDVTDAARRSELFEDSPGDVSLVFHTHYHICLFLAQPLRKQTGGLVVCSCRTPNKSEYVAEL